MGNLNLETGVMEEYDAYEPSPGHKIKRVTGKIAPDQLWDSFISKRRPCVINDTSALGKDWKAQDWTSISHLRELAGSSRVKIEPIGQAGSFGTSAPRKETNFSTYLDLLKDKEESEKWYLTTQYEEEDQDMEETEEESNRIEDENEETNLSEMDSDGEEEALKALLEKETSKSTEKIKPSNVLNGNGSSEEEEEEIEEEEDERPDLDPLFPSPTENLISEFPPQPELLGGLVLQQCNLWLGGCKDGKSSGLHHDFHDNLYVLLSGHKRFLLFPPTAYKYLHIRGEIERVHSNGLITYTPPDHLPYFYPQSLHAGIRADGLPPIEAALWRLSARKRTLAEAEDNAARLNGEEHRGKKERKGKGKMTGEMEEALKGVRMAETELRLIRLREEGEVDWDLEENDDDEEEDEAAEEDDDEEEIDYEAEEIKKRSLDSPTADDYDESSYDSDEVDSIAEAMNNKIDNFPLDALALMSRFNELEDRTGEEAEEIKKGLKPHFDKAREEIELERSKVGKSMTSSKENRKANLKDEIDLDVLKSMIEAGGGEFDLETAQAIIEAEEQSDEESENDDSESEENGAEMKEVESGEKSEDEDDNDDDEEGWRFFDEIEKERMRKEDREAGLEEGNYDTGDSLEISDEDEEEEPLVKKQPSANGKRKRETNDQPTKNGAGKKKSKLQEKPSNVEEAESDSSISNLDESTEETSDSEALFPPRSDADEDEDSEQDWENLEEDLADGEDLLARLGMQQDSLDQEREKSKESSKKKQEPPSFSKIKPEILHAFFGISNTTQSDGKDLTKAEKRKLKKQRKQEARKERRGVQNGKPSKGKAPKAVEEEEEFEDEEKEEQLLLPLEGCPEPLVVDLRPGEMLYLPASWYHEVTSSAAPSTSNSDSTSNVHMALNYWMHPPDALDYYEIQPSPKQMQEHDQKVKKNSTSSSARAISPPTIPDLPPGAPLRYAHRTGDIASPYRDVEVWNEIRRTVQEEIQSCRKRDDMRRQVEEKLNAKINGNQNGIEEDDEEVESESLEDKILERLRGIKANGSNGKGNKRERDDLEEIDDDEEERALEELLQKEMKKNSSNNGEKRKKKKKT